MELNENSNSFFIYITIFPAGIYDLFVFSSDSVYLSAERVDIRSGLPSLAVGSAALSLSPLSPVLHCGGVGVQLSSAGEAVQGPPNRPSLRSQRR